MHFKPKEAKQVLVHVCQIGAISGHNCAKTHEKTRVMSEKKTPQLTRHDMSQLVRNKDMCETRQNPDMTQK